jgi:hypothetical protein
LEHNDKIATIPGLVSGNDWTQSTDSKRATYKTDLEILPVAFFDSGDTYELDTPYVLPSTFTIQWVANPGSSNGRVMIGGDATVTWPIYRGSTNKIETRVNDGVSTQAITGTSEFTSTTPFKGYTWTRDGATSHVFRFYDDFDYSNTIDSGTFDSFGRLSGYGASELSKMVNWHLGEMFIYSRVLTTEEIDSNKDAMIEKWGPLQP